MVLALALGIIAIASMYTTIYCVKKRQSPDQNVHGVTKPYGKLSVITLFCVVLSLPTTQQWRI